MLFSGLSFYIYICTSVLSYCMFSVRELKLQHENYKMKWNNIHTKLIYICTVLQRREFKIKPRVKSKIHQHLNYLLWFSQVLKTHICPDWNVWWQYASVALFDIRCYVLINSEFFCDVWTKQPFSKVSQAFISNWKIMIILLDSLPE